MKWLSRNLWGRPEGLGAEDEQLSAIKRSCDSAADSPFSSFAGSRKGFAFSYVKAHE